MPSTSTLHVISSRTISPDPWTERLANRGRLRKYINDLTGIIGGQARQPTSLIAGLSFAQGTVVFASATGTATITLNGVDNSSAVGASDILTAGLVAAVINGSSNALVANLCRASNLASTIACASVLDNQWVEICGVRMTAKKGAVGTTVLNQFSIGATNTETATNLTSQINLHPVLRDHVFASSSTNTVTIRSRFAASLLPDGTGALTASNATFTLGAAALAASATVLVSSIQKGTASNCITLAAAASGGTATASATRLTGGTNTLVTL